MPHSAARDSANADVMNQAGNAKDWSYDGATGPARWASLSEEYAACDGDAQSPIDIPTSTAARDDTLAALNVSYAPAFAERDPNQHVTTLRVEDAGGIAVDGQRYTLVEFHFHTPSEHTVAGQRFAAEAHFVHEADGDALAVIAVMVEEGTANDALRPVLAGGEDGHEDGHAPAEVDPGALLPSGKAYYTYEGSLTTPPCTEGVRWILMQEPIEASPEQIDRLKGEGTNRPVQPLNGRRVAASE